MKNIDETQERVKRSRQLNKLTADLQDVFHSFGEKQSKTKLVKSIRTIHEMSLRELAILEKHDETAPVH